MDVNFLLRLLLFSVMLVTNANALRCVCYYTNVAQYRPGKGRFLPENINPNLCTHIIFAFAKPDGLDLHPLEWNDESTKMAKGMFSRVIHMKQKNPNLKILLAAGGNKMGSEPFIPLVKTPQTRSTFAKNVILFLRKRHFDGFEMDWVYPADRGSTADDKPKFQLLMEELMRAFTQEGIQTGNPRLLLTVAVPARKPTIDNGFFVANLSRTVDFISIMSYDFHTSWENFVGITSPLYAYTEETEPATQLNVDWVAKYYVSLGAPKDLLNIGVSTYGRSFTLQDSKRDSILTPAIGKGYLGTYSREAGILAYYEICDMALGAEIVQVPSQKNPYLVKGNQWVGYDDVESVKAKACYVRKNGYGGIFIWTIDFDDFMGLSCKQGKFPLLTAAYNTLKDPSAEVCDSGYADDTVLPAESEQELQDIMEPVNNRSAVHGHDNNIKTTKTMIINNGKEHPTMNVSVTGEKLEVVTSSSYVRHDITDDGRSEIEVKMRKRMVKNSVNNMRRLLTSREINNTFQMGIVKTETDTRPTPGQPNDGEVEPPPSEDTFRFVCYYTNWAQYRPGKGQFLPEHIDPELCTHIMYSYAKPVGLDLHPSDNNDDDSPFGHGMYRRVLKMKDKNPGLKILLAAGGYNMGSEPFIPLVQTDVSRTRFAENVLAFLRKRHFDGFGMDWAYPAARGSASTDKPKFQLLMEELKRTFAHEAEANARTPLLLTVAVAAEKDNIDNGYDVIRLAMVTDFISIMTYDLHGANEYSVGLNSPLYAHPTDTEAEQRLNVDWAAQYWVSLGAPKEKLNVGIATYGRSFKLERSVENSIKSPALGAGKPYPYSSQEGIMAYYEICQFIHNESATVVPVSSQGNPYAYKDTLWVGYDDVASVKRKACYARSHHYGGVLFWSIDFDDFSGQFCKIGKYPLLNAAVQEAKSPECK